MLFSSGTLGLFLTILTGTLANPSMYCSVHNNLPPLRLPREGKLIIPDTFKLFPYISLRGIVGPYVPSVDSIGRIYTLMDSQPLRRFLCDIAHQLKRNKALSSLEGWYVAAIDGHEFVSSRKRCCPQCQKRTLTVDGKRAEYYHQGVVCHLIGQSIALVLDVELHRPGEGEETAAKHCSSASSPSTRLL